MGIAGASSRSLTTKQAAGETELIRALFTCISWRCMQKGNTGFGLGVGTLVLPFISLFPVAAVGALGDGSHITPI